VAHKDFLVSRDTVSCHACGAFLGTLNQGDAYAKSRRQTCRIVTATKDVRVFVDLAMSRVEVLCPHCGAIGRTLRGDRIRGIILHISDA